MILFILYFYSQLFADQFHYQNVLVGERAQGLGGAYGGVADDASGVYYNPAGLAFAQSNDISGSANAIYTKKVVYKSVIGEEDFVEKTGGNVFSPFFGVMQKLNSILPGLVGGFAFFTTDQELKDQDTKIENVVMSSEATLARYHRTANERNITYGAHFGMGYRVASNFSVGLSLGANFIDELAQVYQDAITYFPTTNIYALQSRNVRSRLKAQSAVVGLGAQWIIKDIFSIGLTVKGSDYVKQSYDQSEESRTFKISPSNIKNYELFDQSLATVELKKPLGSAPSEARLGMALFASQKFLWTFDTTYTSKVSGASKIYLREATINYATGAEYYVTNSFPVRLGLFTNNAASPKMNPTKYPDGQPLDHVNYTGASIFFAWVAPNSQVALGTVLQQGTGKARKLGDSSIQTVKGESMTSTISATHSF